MIVGIGCDNDGLKIKDDVIDLLKRCNVEVNDLGFNVDYPKIAFDVAKSVALRKISRGVLIGKNAIGLAIAANKVKGVRAARCTTWQEARLSRVENSANVLCVEIDCDVNLILETWLESEFDVNSFVEQINQISQIEGVE